MRLALDLVSHEWVWVAYGLTYGGLIVLATLLDVWLYRMGYWTISEHVWARPWIGVVIVGWLAAGVVGLAAHFFLGWLR